MGGCPSSGCASVNTSCAATCPQRLSFAQPNPIDVPFLNDGWEDASAIHGELEYGPATRVKEKYLTNFTLLPVAAPFYVKLPGFGTSSSRRAYTDQSGIRHYILLKLNPLITPTNIWTGNYWDVPEKWVDPSTNRLHQLVYPMKAAVEYFTPEDNLVIFIENDGTEYPLPYKNIENVKDKKFRIALATLASDYPYILDRQLAYRPVEAPPVQYYGSTRDTPANYDPTSEEYQAKKARLVPSISEFPTGNRGTPTSFGETSPEVEPEFAEAAIGDVLTSDVKGLAVHRVVNLQKLGEIICRDPCKYGCCSHEFTRVNRSINSKGEVVPTASLTAAELSALSSSMGDQLSLEHHDLNKWSDGMRHYPEARAHHLLGNEYVGREVFGF